MSRRDREQRERVRAYRREVEQSRRKKPNHPSAEPPRRSGTDHPARRGPSILVEGRWLPSFTTTKDDCRDPGFDVMGFDGAVVAADWKEFVRPLTTADLLPAGEGNAVLVRHLAPGVRVRKFVTVAFPDPTSN